MNALWDAVRERPDDDGPREVLADALQAAGDPQGELVMLQLLMARGADGEVLRVRERELVRQAGSWLPFKGVRKLAMRRGVVETLWLDGKDDVAELARTPKLAGLRELSIAGLRQPAAVLVEALRGPLCNVRSLSISRTSRQTALGAAVAGLPLDVLTLAACELTDDDAAAIAERADPRLVSLELSFNWFHEGGARALAKAARLARLQRFDLTDNPLGDHGGLAFAQELALPALADVDLSWCGLHDAVPALVRAPRMAAVHTLDLRGNEVSAAHLGVLATEMPALRKLFLQARRLSEAAVEELRRARPDVQVDFTELDDE